MNRIVKAFIISIVLSSILLAFFWYAAQKGHENKGTLSFLTKKAVPSYSVNGTLLLPGGAPGNAQTTGVLNKRLTAVCHQFTLTTTNDSRWALSAAGVTDTQLLKQLLTTNSGLQLYEVYEVWEIYPFLKTADSLLYLQQESIQRSNTAAQSISATDTSITALLLKKPQQSGHTDSTKHPLLWFIKLSDRDFYKSSIPLSEIGFVLPRDTATLSSYLKNRPVSDRFPADMVFMYGVPYEIDGADIYVPLYAIKTERPKPVLDESYIKTVQLRANAVTGKENIIFHFNSIGTGRWERMTKKNIGKSIAIVSNGIVFSAPTVYSSISGGGCELSNVGSHSDRILLSALMKYGPLGGPVTIEQLSFIPSGLFNHPWAKYLLVWGIAFVVFFALALFIGRAIQNAFKTPPVPRTRG